MLIFSIKNVFRKKLIAILASLGVGFGLMLVFVLGAFSAGVTAQFQENLSEVVGQVQVNEKLQQGADSGLPLNITTELYNTPNVGEHIIQYNVETQVPNYFTINYAGEDSLVNAGDRLLLIGLNLTKDQAWGGPTTKLIENSQIFGLNLNETIIDSRLAEVAQFPVDIGDEIEINLDLGGTITANLSIVGIYEQADFGAPSFVPREYYIYTDLQTIWNFLSLAGEDTDIYTSVLLRFDAQSNEETTQYAEAINEYSEDDGYSPTYIEAFSLAAFQEAIEDTFGILNAFVTIIGLITAIAGGMAIIVTQLMSVTSRMKEFAILKATGWKNRHIFQNVIFESLTLGFIGAAIGMGIGFTLIALLSSGNLPFGGVSAIVTIDGILQVIIYALVLGIIGGLYPGIKASRVRPVKVLKGE